MCLSVCCVPKQASARTTAHKRAGHALVYAVEESPNASRRMSSLDPVMAMQSAPSLLPYNRLALLALNQKLPPLPGTATGKSASVQVSVAVQTSDAPSGQKISLDISRMINGKPKSVPKEKQEKTEKKEKQPAAKAAASATPVKKPSSSGVTVGTVPANEPPPLDAKEIAACQVEQTVSPIQARLQKECDALGLSSAHFWRVRGDYYEQPLEWRRDVLGAKSVTQLCKSMIMENTKLTAEEAQAAGRVKYVCIVLQYAGAKLNKEKLTDLVRRMEGKNAIGKKQYSMRMVAQDVSDKLSGFEHNAVTPIGMATPVPVVLSDKLKSLPDGQVWMGGGEVDLKLRFDVAQLCEKFTPAGRPIEFADLLEAH